MWQAIRPDEESDLPVDLPEEKSGKEKAQEDNEENAGGFYEWVPALAAFQSLTEVFSWTSGSLKTFAVVSTWNGPQPTQTYLAAI